MRTNVKRNILVLVTLLTLLIATLAGFFITRSNNKAYADSIDKAKSIVADYTFTIKDSTAGTDSHFIVPMSLTNERVVMRKADYELGEKEDYLGGEFSGSVSGINTQLKTDFGKELSADQTFHFMWSDDKLNPSLYPRILWDFTYTLATDTLTVKITINHAFSNFFDYDPFNSATEGELLLALTKDMNNASDTLNNDFDMTWDMKYPSQEVASVTFKWWNGVTAWNKVTKFFHVGETPVFPIAEANRYHNAAFRRWEPAIAPVASTDEITYTAVYGNPTLTITDTKTGTTTTETLFYDFLDEDLLFANFTNEFKDIGSIESMPADIIEFKNRRDFWFVKYSDNITVHTIDTNLTLEAVSFRFRKKGTDEYLSFEKAKELHGTCETNWNWFKYVVKNGGAADSDSIFEQWLSSVSVMFGGKKNKKSDLMDDFVNTYYPDAVIKNPDEYDLAYVYYYSVDLNKSDEQATFVYDDEFPPSVLKVKNNLDDTVWEYPFFSYDESRGCYFKFCMSDYWAAMNKVSSVRADYYGGNDNVKAEISNARFTVSGFDGTVEYDEEQANNLELALATVVTLYTEKLKPNYAGEYTVTVNFTDFTVIQEDRTDNVGTVVDNVGDKISGWWNNFKANMGDAWKWSKIIFWVVIGLLILIVVAKIISLIVNFIGSGQNNRRPRRRK